MSEVRSGEYDSALLRAAMLLESTGELLCTRFTTLKGEWPDSASMWKARHAELIDSAAELRAMEAKARLGEREG